MHMPAVANRSNLKYTGISIHIAIAGGLPRNVPLVAVCQGNTMRDLPNGRPQAVSYSKTNHYYYYFIPVLRMTLQRV